VVRKNDFVFQVYCLPTEDVCLIEIVYLIVVVSIERDSMVVEHYYKMQIADCYCYYYYYLMDTGVDMIVELVLVEMLALDLNKRSTLS
jgi:hypothetical protein